MTLEFILKNIDRYRELEKFFLAGALQALGIAFLFSIYIGVIFTIISLFNLSAAQLTAFTMVFSMFNFILSVLYLRKAL